MNINYKSLYKISYILIVILISGLLLPLIDYNRVEAKEESIDRDGLSYIERELLDEAQKIYHEYAAEDFSFVYNKLHPAIREIMTEEEYSAYQEEGFDEYQLKINDIRVNPEIEMVELPREFREIINKAEGNKIYRVVVSYEMDFKHAGSRKTRQVDNPVFLLRSDIKYYLLWDPNIIKDEEEGV
ncbi:MAG: hypothetical protein ACLFPF_07455 [Halanaerobiales bacterium]